LYAVTAQCVLAVMVRPRVVSYRSASEPVLTVRQPWASLIVDGIKDVENRSWSTDYRGRLWIHAGASRVDDEPDYRELAADAPRGVVLGSVTLVDVVRDARSPWAMSGQCHWLLAGATRLKVAVPANGRLGLWPLPGHVGT
jgi:hypothetical protein